MSYTTKRSGEIRFTKKNNLEKREVRYLHGEARLCLLGKALLLLLRANLGGTPNEARLLIPAARVRLLAAGCSYDQHARIGKAVLLLLKALLYIPKRCDPPVALA